MIDKVSAVEGIEGLVAEQTAARVTRARDLVARVGLPLIGMTEERFGSEVAHWLWHADMIAKGAGRAARRNEAERIAKAIANIQRDVAAFIAAYGYIPAFSSDGRFFTAESCQSELDGVREQFAIESRQAAEDLRDRRGWEKFIAVDLADLFERAFGQPAHVLRAEDGSPDLKEIYTGPFVQLAQGIISLAGSSVEGSTIDKYLKRRKKNEF